jgi:hypothetical protein
MRYPAHSQLYMGPGRVLYCGALQHLDTHVYGADVLHVGIHGPFRMFLSDGEWRHCRCALVPAGTPHALDVAGGVHGKLFLERHGASWSSLRNWKRMVAAVQSLHRADNMTRAALEAGSADATHFSHSFRQTFGVNPAPVFRRIERFEVTAS